MTELTNSLVFLEESVRKNKSRKQLTQSNELNSLALVMVRGYTKRQVVEMIKAKLADRSQADLAREIGISRGYLADVLSGKSHPGPSILPYFGLEPGYIKSERAA